MRMWRICTMSISDHVVDIDYRTNLRSRKEGPNHASHRIEGDGQLLV